MDRPAKTRRPATKQTWVSQTNEGGYGAATAAQYASYEAQAYAYNYVSQGGSSSSNYASSSSAGGYGNGGGYTQVNSSSAAFYAQQQGAWAKQGSSSSSSSSSANHINAINAGGSSSYYGTTSAHYGTNANSHYTGNATGASYQQLHGNHNGQGNAQHNSAIGNLPSSSNQQFDPGGKLNNLNLNAVNPGGSATAAGDQVYQDDGEYSDEFHDENILRPGDEGFAPSLDHIADDNYLPESLSDGADDLGEGDLEEDDYSGGDEMDGNGNHNANHNANHNGNPNGNPNAGGVDELGDLQSDAADLYTGSIPNSPEQDEDAGEETQNGTGGNYAGPNGNYGLGGNNLNYADMNNASNAANAYASSYSASSGFVQNSYIGNSNQQHQQHQYGQHTSAFNPNTVHGIPGEQRQYAQLEFPHKKKAAARNASRKSSLKNTSDNRTKTRNNPGNNQFEQYAYGGGNHNVGKFSGGLNGAFDGGFNSAGSEFDQNSFGPDGPGDPESGNVFSEDDEGCDNSSGGFDSNALNNTAFDVDQGALRGGLAGGLAGVAPSIGSRLPSMGGPNFQGDTAGGRSRNGISRHGKKMGRPKLPSDQKKARRRSGKKQNLSDLNDINFSNLNNLPGGADPHQFQRFDPYQHMQNPSGGESKQTQSKNNHNVNLTSRGTRGIAKNNPSEKKKPTMTRKTKQQLLDENQRLQERLLNAEQAKLNAEQAALNAAVNGMGALPACPAFPPGPPPDGTGYPAGAGHPNGGGDGLSNGVGVSSGLPNNGMGPGGPIPFQFPPGPRTIGGKTPYMGGVNGSDAPGMPQLPHDNFNLNPGPPNLYGDPSGPSGSSASSSSSSTRNYQNHNGSPPPNVNHQSGSGGGPNDNFTTLPRQNSNGAASVYDGLHVYQPKSIGKFNSGADGGFQDNQDNLNSSPNFDSPNRRYQSPNKVQSQSGIQNVAQTELDSEGQQLLDLLQFSPVPSMRNDIMGPPGLAKNADGIPNGQSGGMLELSGNSGMNNLKILNLELPESLELPVFDAVLSDLDAGNLMATEGEAVDSADNASNTAGSGRNTKVFSDSKISFAFKMAEEKKHRKNIFNQNTEKTGLQNGVQNSQGTESSTSRILCMDSTDASQSQPVPSSGDEAVNNRNVMGDPGGGVKKTGKNQKGAKKVAGKAARKLEVTDFDEPNADDTNRNRSQSRSLSRTKSLSYDSLDDDTTGSSSESDDGKKNEKDKSKDRNHVESLKDRQDREKKDQDVRGENVKERKPQEDEPKEGKSGENESEKHRTAKNGEAEIECTPQRKGTKGQAKEKLNAHQTDSGKKDDKKNRALLSSSRQFPFPESALKPNLNRDFPDSLSDVLAEIYDDFLTEYPHFLDQIREIWRLDEYEFVNTATDLEAYPRGYVVKNRNHTANVGTAGGVGGGNIIDYTKENESERAAAKGAAAIAAKATKNLGSPPPPPTGTQPKSGRMPQSATRPATTPGTVTASGHRTSSPQVLVVPSISSSSGQRTSKRPKTKTTYASLHSSGITSHSGLTSHSGIISHGIIPTAGATVSQLSPGPTASLNSLATPSPDRQSNPSVLAKSSQQKSNKSHKSPTLQPDMRIFFPPGYVPPAKSPSESSFSRFPIAMNLGCEALAKSFVEQNIALGGPQNGAAFLTSNFRPSTSNFGTNTCGASVRGTNANFAAPGTPLVELVHGASNDAKDSNDAKAKKKNRDKSRREGMRPINAMKRKSSSKGPGGATKGPGGSSHSSGSRSNHIPPANSMSAAARAAAKVGAQVAAQAAAEAAQATGIGASRSSSSSAQNAAAKATPNRASTLPPAGSSAVSSSSSAAQKSNTTPVPSTASRVPPTSRSGVATASGVPTASRLPYAPDFTSLVPRQRKRGKPDPDTGERPIVYDQPILNEMIAVFLKDDEDKSFTNGWHRCICTHVEENRFEVTYLDGRKLKRKFDVTDPDCKWSWIPADVFGKLPCRRRSRRGMEMLRRLQEVTCWREASREAKKSKEKKENADPKSSIPDGPDMKKKRVKTKTTIMGASVNSSLNASSSSSSSASSSSALNSSSVGNKDNPASSLSTSCPRFPFSYFPTAVRRGMLPTSSTNSTTTPPNNNNYRHATALRFWRHVRKYDEDLASFYGSAMDQVLRDQSDVMDFVSKNYENLEFWGGIGAALRRNGVRDQGNHMDSVRSSGNDLNSDEEFLENHDLYFERSGMWEEEGKREGTRQSHNVREGRHSVSNPMGSRNRSEAVERKLKSGQEPQEQKRRQGNSSQASSSQANYYSSRSMQKPKPPHKYFLDPAFVNQHKVPEVLVELILRVHDVHEPADVVYFPQGLFSCTSSVRIRDTENGSDSARDSPAKPSESPLKSLRNSSRGPSGSSSSSTTKTELKSDSPSSGGPGRGLYSLILRIPGELVGVFEGEYIRLDNVCWEDDQRNQNVKENEKRTRENARRMKANEKRRKLNENYQNDNDQDDESQPLGLLPSQPPPTFPNRDMIERYALLFQHVHVKESFYVDPCFGENYFDYRRCPMALINEPPNGVFANCEARSILNAMEVEHHLRFQLWIVCSLPILPLDEIFFHYGDEFERVGYKPGLPAPPTFQQMRIKYCKPVTKRGVTKGRFGKKVQENAKQGVNDVNHSSRKNQQVFNQRQTETQGVSGQGGMNKTSSGPGASSSNSGSNDNVEKTTMPAPPRAPASLPAAPSPANSLNQNRFRGVNRDSLNQTASSLNQTDLCSPSSSSSSAMQTNNRGNVNSNFCSPTSMTSAVTSAMSSPGANEMSASGELKLMNFGTWTQKQNGNQSGEKNQKQSRRANGDKNNNSTRHASPRDPLADTSDNERPRKRRKQD